MARVTGIFRIHCVDPVPRGARSGQVRTYLVHAPSAMVAVRRVRERYDTRPFSVESVDMTEPMLCFSYTVTAPEAAALNLRADEIDAG